MCAECHSTDLKKNYNYKERTYHTTWKEIDVSCEACHGPGSVHVLWAEAKEKGNAPEIPFKGFTMSFKDPYNGTWVFPKDSSIARRTHPHNTRQLIAMCARCHARRGTLDEDYRFGKSLPDTHSPSLLKDNLYFADGQIKDEDYEYASFLQSKMYKAGVFCTDCHDPHSAKVYVAGNALCYRCHSAEKYGSKLHHFHNVNSAGAKCVSCHMPTRTYMAVDPRLDHSIRIPRPDLTLKLGTPNACNQCHSDKTAQWALNAFKKWYGDPSRFGTHYGEVIAEARKASPLVKQDLIQWATDTSASPMVRATMLSLMQNVPGATEEQPVIRELSDPDPLVRYGAEQAASILNNNEKSKYLFKALKDSVLLIRTNAASILTTSQVNFENQKDQELLSQVTGEYILTQLTNADFPSSWLNLGLLYWSQHRSGAAEEAYKRSIELGPGLPYGYINLADLYRQENREEDGEKILREGLSENPSMAGVHYALALLLVRKQDQENAIRELKTAVKLEPDNPEYNYTLGIAMYSSGDPGMAVSILEKALTSSPYNQEILYALATINRDLHQSAKALHYADLLVKYYPENRNFLLLRNSLAQ
jgi:predicted CXXCH cytochrome family protein